MKSSKVFCKCGRNYKSKQDAKKCCNPTAKTKTEIYNRNLFKSINNE